MEVILLQNVDNLGIASDVVTVKNGYGRNYLIPQKMAVIANDKNKNVLSQKLNAARVKEEQLIAQLNETAEKLKAGEIKVGAKTGTSGKIFGAVTNIQVASAIKEQLGVEIERKKIVIEENIKELGTYKAKISLHAIVKIDVNFEVVAE